MRARELAMMYLQIVFHGSDFRRLEEICVPELSFAGPWYRFDTREGYIRLLEVPPPPNNSATI